VDENEKKKETRDKLFSVKKRDNLIYIMTAL